MQLLQTRRLDSNWMYLLFVHALTNGIFQLFFAVLLQKGNVSSIQIGTYLQYCKKPFYFKFWIN